MPYLLAAIAVLMLCYAAFLLRLVRAGRKIPQPAYLGLFGLNGLLVAALLAWAIAR